ncbi:MAG: pyridoxamine 5'-phosphate oxidase family protein [Anaerolineae bacterium]|nr:pyridoxamine 5'-phosphate oxidase family protein [Anaerolineae bacterium]
MAKQVFDDRQQMETVIRRATYCQVAFAEGSQPYVVPLNFGYEAGCFYFHSRNSGKKLALLRGNPRVAFSLQSDVETLHNAEQAENCTMRYASVIGSGSAAMIEDRDEKIAALDAICRQYGLQPYPYSDAMLNATALFKVVVSQMTGKIANIDCGTLFAEV